MIAATTVRAWELDRTPDLADLVTAARDAGHEVMLIERPMPDAVSVAAIGRVLDISARPELAPVPRSCVCSARSSSRP